MAASITKDETQLQSYRELSGSLDLSITVIVDTSGSDWILRHGIWEDIGFWRDSDFWIE